MDRTKLPKLWCQTQSEQTSEMFSGSGMSTDGTGVPVDLFHRDNGYV
jgi:hypothetical protein